ncbi:hypothetical protein NQZ68_016355 [Dissostichus eleginoides]|nr:hypothetical protein NQZ68_016355 [Dissostichus eleginoides]
MNEGYQNVVVHLLSLQRVSNCIQGWKYASVKRPPLLPLPVTPGAAHNQPEKRQSVAVSGEPSAD